jgi:hypothetical protein
MAGIRMLGRSAWLLGCFVVFLAGCSGSGPTGKAGSPGSGGAKSGDDLAGKIGDYMPPLDGGKLEIAAPKGWDWANPGGGALVAFKPKEAEINALPRVLLSVADSEFPGIDDVTSSNVEDFVRLLAASITDQKPKEAARAVTIGGRQFARYLVLGKRRNQVVAQQYLVTAAGGRVYTLRLEVYQAQFDKYKSVLNVIAASMKFDGEGEPATATPAAEQGETEKPAAAAPEEPAAEKAPAEKEAAGKDAAEEDTADGAKADQ